MAKVDWTALLRREQAASALSYGLVVGLVSVLSIGAVQSVGDSVTSLFGGVAEDLGRSGDGTPASGGDDTPTPNQPPSLTTRPTRRLFRTRPQPPYRSLWPMPRRPRRP